MTLLYVLLTNLSKLLIRSSIHIFLFSFIIDFLVTLPAAEMIRWQLKTIAEKLGGWLSYVAGLAGLSLVLCFGLIIDSHRSSYMVYVDTLESELRKARSEYKTKQNEIDEKVTKRMARMPKH